MPVARRRRPCISSTKEAINSTAGGIVAVGLATWYWRYRFIVTLSIKTRHAGATVVMAEARSVSVVCGPTTKVWMLNLFCTSETRLLRTSTNIDEPGMAMRTVGAPLRAGG